MGERRERLVIVPIALYAGSFDPIHLGHLGVIERAAAAFDGVVVGVLANSEKKQGMFAPEARVRLVNDTTAHLPNVSCLHFSGLTVEAARSVGASALLRVTHKEHGDELSMAAMNLMLAGIPTVMLPPNAETTAISSSVVRKLVMDGQVAAASRLVPPSVGAALGTVRSTIVG